MSHPSVGFPIPPFQWPHVGRQWPAYNVESDQADGLMAWWPTLASAGSNILRDLIAGEYNADSVNGAVIIPTAQLGPAMVLDGTDQYFDCGATPFTQNSSRTVTAWVRNRGGTGVRVICGTVDATPDRCPALYLNNRVFSWEYGTDTGNATAITFTDYEWYRVALSYTTAGAVTVHCNGQEVDTGAGGALGVNAISFLWGAYSNNGTPSLYWLGDIGDCRVYDGVRTGARQLSDMEMPWELYQIPRRLWRLGAIAPPPPTIVPVVMHHYRSRRL